MNESDCEELLNNICDKIHKSMSDENIKTELITDLKLINNSYKSIIEWKKRQIFKLNNELLQLKQQQNSKQLSHSLQIQKQFNCKRIDSQNNCQKISLINKEINNKVNNNCDQRPTNCSNNNVINIKSSFSSDLNGVNERTVDNNLINSFVIENDNQLMSKTIDTLNTFKDFVIIGKKSDNNSFFCSYCRFMSKNNRIDLINHVLDCHQNQINCNRIEINEQKSKNPINSSTNNSELNSSETTNNRSTNDVECVQTLSIGNRTIDCVIGTNGRDIESDNETNGDENSLNDMFSSLSASVEPNCVEFEIKAGRHCRSLVWQYFRYDSTHNITHCLVKECTSKGIRGKLAGNLKRHLRTHPKQYIEFTKAIDLLEQNIDLNKKELNKCSNESIASNASDVSDERSFELFEINEYLVSNPREESATDIVYPYRQSSIGRKYESTVWKFFNYDPNSNISYCLVTNCKSKGIRGKLAGNLRKHLMTHKREFDELVKRESIRNSIESSVCIETNCDYPTDANHLNLKQVVTSALNSMNFSLKRTFNQNLNEFDLNFTNKRMKNEFNNNYIDLA